MRAVSSAILDASILTRVASALTCGSVGLVAVGSAAQSLSAAPLGASRVSAAYLRLPASSICHGPPTRDMSESAHAASQSSSRSKAGFDSSSSALSLLTQCVRSRSRSQRCASSLRAPSKRGGTVIVALATELAGTTGAIERLETRIDGISSIVEGQLERARAAGEVREGVDLRLFSSAVCGAFLFAAFRRIREQGDAFDAPAFSTELMDLVTQGVMA